MKKKYKRLESTYFKLYEKYLDALGINGIEQLTIEIEPETLKYIEKLANKYNCTVDGIIGGLLQIKINRNE
jgi:hypothetical protein